MSFRARTRTCLANTQTYSWLVRSGAASARILTHMFANMVVFANKYTYKHIYIYMYICKYLRTPLGAPSGASLRTSPLTHLYIYFGKGPFGAAWPLASRFVKAFVNMSLDIFVKGASKYGCEVFVKVFVIFLLWHLYVMYLNKMFKYIEVILHVGATFVCL